MQPKPSQNLFYVYRHGDQKGPWSLAEIASSVRSRKLELNDYVYDESANDWILLASHAGLADLLKTFKSEPSQVGVKHVELPAADEWFALKGSLRFGPFAYTEVVRLLQEKSMHDSDFVWRSGLKEWQKVADLSDFSVDAIRTLRETGGAKLDEVFFRRRHARISHDGSILLHNNQKVFRGKKPRDQRRRSGSGFRVPRAPDHRSRLLAF